MIQVLANNSVREQRQIGHKYLNDLMTPLFLSVVDLPPDQVYDLSDDRVEKSAQVEATSSLVFIS
jgi:hypothetical protein